MNPSNHRITRTVVLVAFLCLPSACGLFSDGGTGLANVDDLVTAIERVHVDTELAQQEARTAMDHLEAMMAPDFVGNPVVAHTELVAAVERSTQQAAVLRESFDGMQDAAGPVFDRWAADLEQFASPTLRMRSETRMQRTRARYEAIVVAVEPALAHCDALNRPLSDHALFLGHDFNASAVAEIRDDVRLLAAQTKALEGEFGSCLVAARSYLDAAAMPEGTSPTGPSAAPGN